MASFTGTNNLHRNWFADLGNVVTSSLNASSALRVRLHALAPDPASHTRESDLPAAVASAGYQGDVTPTSVTWAYTGLNTKLDSADVVFTASGGQIVAEYWSMFFTIGAAASNPVIQSGELNGAGGSVTVEDTDAITISPHPNGWNDITIP